MNEGDRPSAARKSLALTLYYYYYFLHTYLPIYIRYTYLYIYLLIYNAVKLVKRAQSKLEGAGAHILPQLLPKLYDFVN